MRSGAHIVVSFIPFSHHILKVCFPVPLSDSTFATIPDFPYPSLFITRLKNMSPKASAADTYTGTMASEMNSLMVNFPTHLSLNLSHRT